MRIYTGFCLSLFLVILCTLTPMANAQGVYGANIFDEDEGECNVSVFIDVDYTDQYYYEFYGYTTLLDEDIGAVAWNEGPCSPGGTCAQIDYTGTPGHSYYGVGTLYVRMCFWVPFPPEPYEEGWYDPSDYARYEIDGIYVLNDYLWWRGNFHYNDMEWSSLGTIYTNPVLLPSVVIQVDDLHRFVDWPWTLKGQGYNASVWANGTPSGGTYEWSIGPKLGYIGSLTSSSIGLYGTDASQNWDDTWIQVRYTRNNSHKTASIRFTVREPVKLVTTGAGSTITIPGGYITYVSYTLYDQLPGQWPLQADLMGITEVCKTVSVSHPVVFDPIDGQPRTGQFENSVFRDSLSVTGNPPYNFSGVRTQTLTMGGLSAFQVQTQTYTPTYATVSLNQLVR